MVTITKTKCKIEGVLLNPDQRLNHIRNLLRLDGLAAVKENNGIYCALPLTGVPEELRKFIEDEHEKIKVCIRKAGLEIYDPKDAGMNPWIKIIDSPQKVYDLDTVQVAVPKFFEFTNIFPSTGAGIEEQKAIMYVKVPIIVTKSGVYTSRMSTGARRVILIEYSDAKAQQDEITGVFEELRKYEIGIGACSEHGNTSLGFSDKKGPICLSGLIAEKIS